MLEIIGRGVISRVPGRGAYMAFITPLPDGTFIASQHVGSKLGTPDNYIEVLRSKDGKTWVNQGSIHKTGGAPNDGWSYRGPKIDVLPDGRLIMITTRFDAAAEIFNVDTEAAVRAEPGYFLSADKGKTWGDFNLIPVDLDPDRYTWNHAGIFKQLAPNRWMMPLETWKPASMGKAPPDQKALAIFSADQGKTWGDLTVVAYDPTHKTLYWDQMNAVLPDGRIYTLIWTHKYGTSEDLNNHWVMSEDQGRTWTKPKATNLMGQVCTPIPLPDGRVAAIYNFRHEPQGIHIAITEDFSNFDVRNEVVVFDAGKEATLGKPEGETFIAEHMKIAFGLPMGRMLANGDILTFFWCTTGGVTHTRWVRLRVK